MPQARSKNIFFSGGFNNWVLLLLVLAGTLVRFCYGRATHPWYIAPDQLAWQLGLDEMLNTGRWNWLQLTHAPHEGGSGFIGICAMIIAPLKTGLPPLSLVALLADTMTRLLQIMIARGLFGAITAAWFGIWTVLSIPLLLPWSVVNFGLHYPASVFPFVFFWLAGRYQGHRFFPQLLGITCALAICFAYENLLLIIPATWLMITGQSQKSRSIAWFLVTLFICLLPHVLLRFMTDMGYPFQSGILPGRTNTGGTLHPGHLLTIWFTVLPASLLLQAVPFVPSGILVILVLLFIGSGVWLYLRKTQTQGRWWIIGFVIFFLSVYAVSGFSTGALKQPAYTVYRHLAYIAPLLVVLMIDGFTRSGRLLLYGWLLLCGVASVVYMQAGYKDAKQAYRAAGWVMVEKYGTDLPRLFRMQNMADTAFRKPLAAGFGWGFAAFLFRKPADTAAVDRLHQLIVQSPAPYQQDMLIGVAYAFSPGITPVLPASSQQLFNTRK